MSYTPFKQLSAQLAKKPGVTDADALTASIAARKYGANKFNHAAATGHSLKGKKAAGKQHAAALAVYMKQHGS